MPISSNDNTLFLYGSVGASWWEEDFFTSSEVRDWLQGRSGSIQVRINSGGGLVMEGQGIYALLSDYPGDVDVIVDGVAWSSASVIAMAGDTIRMRQGSTMLIHDPAQPYTPGRGTEEDHLAIARQLSEVADSCASLYASRTKLTHSQVRDIMREDTMLSPTNAVALGFATQVIQESASQAAAFGYALYGKFPPNYTPSQQANLQSSQQQLPALLRASSYPANRKDLHLMPPVTTPSPGPGSGTLLPQPQVSSDTLTQSQAPSNPQPPAPPDPVQENSSTLSSSDINHVLMVAEIAGLAINQVGAITAQARTLSEALERVQTIRQEQSRSSDPVRPSPARVTGDRRDRVLQGISRALYLKSDLPNGERNEFTSMSLSEIARICLDVGGFTSGFSFSDRMSLVGSAFTMVAGGHSTSDFANILADVQNKSVLKGWEEADETFETWTSVGTLTDFKPTKRVDLGAFPAVLPIIEGSEYKYGTIGDRGETVTLATYGRMVRITRQAIINDDLSMLSRVPQRMGRAAKRTIGNLVYAILTGNPLMSDGIALFHTASHGNLSASSTALSEASLSAARAAMSRQKEQVGVATSPSLNIRPKYLLVPVSLQTQAEVLMSSTVNPAANMGHAKNGVQNMAQVIADARLDDSSLVSWYLAADQNMFDTIEVSYLDGVRTPVVEQQNGWTVDGVEMKVRIDAAATPLDFRTFYKNPGA